MRKNKVNRRVIRALRKVSFDNLTDRCNRELENFFNMNFQMIGLKRSRCSIGSHFISIPFKVAGFKNGKTVTYITKIVTKKP